ncbi:sulfatase-like hydrolase/transferase [Paenibacillus sp. BK720]|uniref:sulfatase-like hydrolase/transferase n=1 Tax=Paenibacillus sp. BK720 TaxID=2587092 RepID=UPI00142253F2|nr:sulfatase-like hydrolase/transferase [Paenibacillus sp. BK720]NIK67292.1 choline-sulfatase [Paenibacillus sp. BK720]
MKATKRPNIVMIIMDECKWNVLGSYGNPDAYTPHIDRLAAQGMQFEHAYVTFPKCVPSRAALMTGRYPHVEGHRTLPGFEVRKDENNLVLELKRAGYTTGIFGKNHTMEGEFLSECFDEKGIRWGKGVPRDRREFETDDSLFRAFYRGDFSGTDEMADTLSTRDAIDFIERRSQEDQPFFLLLNYHFPHPPYADIEPYISIIRERNIKLPVRVDINSVPQIMQVYREVYDLEHLKDDDWRKVVEGYYSMVSYVDDQIEKMVQSIDNAQIAEDTVLILTSDHGDFAGEHVGVEKWDTVFYDCLVRVPLIIRWPGVVAAGRTDAMTENIDLAPTLLELCGLDAQDWMQGKSLYKLLMGETDSHKEEVFCEGGVEESALTRTVMLDSEDHKKRQPNYHWKQQLIVDYPWTIYRAKMIRTRHWKLVYRINGIKELYDLLEDPLELRDVAHLSENKEIVSELIERLLNWTVRTETDYPRIHKMYS